MEAFAVCGLDLSGPSSGEIREPEWQRCIVGICVVLGDRPRVEAPWEVCGGSMNGGFGLRRASLAVRQRECLNRPTVPRAPNDKEALVSCGCVDHDRKGRGVLALPIESQVGARADGDSAWLAMERHRRN